MIVIARLTVKELVRRRVVWVLAILTLVSVALVGWGLDRLVTLAREGGSEPIEIEIGVSQVLILIAFMFSFVLAMTAAFVGAPAIGGDLESGVAYAILARPLRRADLLLGRWLGSAVVVAAYAAASGLLAIAVAAFVSGYWPPDPPLAIAFLVGEALVLLTLTLALGSVLPSIAAGAIAVVGFGLGWMAGVLAGVGGGARGRGPRLRRRGEPLAAADRRPVARGHLRPRAAAGRADRGWARARARQCQPVLRRDAAAAAVRDLVGRLDGARARCRDLVVRPARPLGDGPRSAAVAEALRQVVVDEPDALHERVDDRRADEPEAALLEVRRQRVRRRRRGRDRRRPPRRPAGAPAAAAPSSRDTRRTTRTPPPSPGRPPRSRSSRRSWRRCGRSRRRPSGAPGPLRRRRPRPADRTPGTPRGRPRACAGSSTTTAPPGTTRGRAARTARCRRGTAGPTRHRGRRPSAGRDPGGRRRPRNSAVVVRSRGHDSVTQGIGAVANSVLRSIGSAVGRPALNTDRKTSPETVFVPVEPIRVTLISRPETPRSRRSIALSVPTAVRGSAANQADSCSLVYGLRRPGRVRGGLVVGRPVRRSIGSSHGGN